MDKTKEEYVQFLRHAMESRNSPEYIELYQFLLQVFVRADANMDGMVTMDEFPVLLDTTTALPQKYGFTADVKSHTKEQNEALFKAMDENGDGHISFEEWLAFALDKGIMGDVKSFGKNILVGADVTKEEFLAFMKKAASDKESTEFRELFYFLLKCFSDADKDRDGAVQPSEFDTMIEIAAAAPRRHGLAPTTASMFKNDADRLAKREEYFKAMDENNDGNISLDEWVKFCYQHIVKKVAGL